MTPEVLWKGDTKSSVCRLNGKTVKGWWVLNQSQCLQACPDNGQQRRNGRCECVNDSQCLYNGKCSDGICLGIVYEGSNIPSLPPPPTQNQIDQTPKLNARGVCELNGKIMKNWRTLSTEGWPNAGELCQQMCPVDGQPMINGRCKCTGVFTCPEGTTCVNGICEGEGEEAEPCNEQNKNKFIGNKLFFTYVPGGFGPAISVKPPGFERGMLCCPQKGGWFRTNKCPSDYQNDLICNTC